MADDTEDKVVEEAVPDEAPAEPKEELEEEVTEEVDPAPAEEETTEEEPEKPPSRREQLRIQDLLKKYGPPPERPVTSQARSQEQLDYGKALDAEPEVIEQLEADRRKVADSEYRRGLEESNRHGQELQYMQFYNNIRFDLPLVSEKLSKIDPIDAKAIDDEYIALTGVDSEKGYVRNPNIGYAEFVEARLEQAQRLAASMNAQTVKNVAKQSAQTGLRPDGSAAKRMNLNQAPQSMTNEELEAVIKQAGL